MNSFVNQQPSSSTSFDGRQEQMQTSSMKSDVATVAGQVASRDHFPKGLRGGGPCFDCLACLCCCCAIEEIACFECCKDC